MKKNYKSFLFIIAFLFSLKGFSQLPIYSEGFGSGFSFPGAWTAATGDWGVDDGSGISPCALSGSSGASSMYAADIAGGGSIENSITASFSTIGKNNLTLDYNLRMFDALSPTLTLSYSLDNITYTVISSPTVPQDDNWYAVTTINLPTACEGQATVYLKWEYPSGGTFSYSAIDDILVTGPVFYWNGVGALHLLSSWGKATDGSGSAPTSFTATGQTFNLVNGASPTLTSNWTLDGAGTSLLIGDGVFNANFTIPSGFNITLANATTSLICSANSTLTLANLSLPPANKVFLNAISTIDYAQAASVNLLNLTYNNLTISGASFKSISSNITVTGTLDLSNDLKMSGSFLHTLNLSGTVIGAGLFRTGNCKVVITGSGPFGTMTFTTGSTASSVNTFSVDRSGAGSVTFGSNLTVAANLALANGTLDLNGTSLTANGIVTIASGVIKGSSTSSLTIGGGGAQVITGSLMMDPTSASSRSLFDLTLNRSGQTLTLGNPLEIFNSVTPTLGNLDAGGNLTLKSSAARKARIGIVGGTITGNVTVETFALGGSTGWTNLGPSGVSGLSVSSWDGQIPMSCSGCINDEFSAGGRFVSIQGWDETKSGGAEYVELTGASPLDAGTGYWVYLGNGFSATTDLLWTVSGAPVVGTKLVPVTNSAQAGFNLVANPYASPISWNAVRALPANAGLAAAIYVWDPDLGGGAGATVSMAGGVSVPGGLINDDIPMGQGFYIDASGGPVGNITFSESCKSTGNTQQLLKSAGSPTVGQVFRLTVSGASGDNDETAIRFHGSATNLYDNDLDAHKIFKSPGYLGYPGVYSDYTTISTRLSGEDYSINSVPFAISKDAVIPVLVKVVATGVYTISPVDIEELNPSSCVILKDKFLGITHDLRTGSYICNISDTTTVPRFELTVCFDASSAGSSNTAIQEAAASRLLLINQDQNGPYVKTRFETVTKATISAYNTMGQKLMADKEVEGKEMTTYLDLGNVHSQVVIIRVTTPEQSTTKKLYVN